MSSTAGMNEEEYLAYYAAEERDRYPRAANTVDAALFTVRSGVLSLLLVRRAGHPERGKWALPGGFVDLGSGGYGEGEDLEAAALRELAEETGIVMPPGLLQQLGTYGDPWRDRRGRVISTVYVALLEDAGEPSAGDDAAEARFFAAVELAGGQGPPLAFDHDRIVADAFAAVRSMIG